MKRRQSIRRSRLARHLPQSEPLESRVLLSSTLESDLLSQPADTPVAAAVLATTESIYLSDLTPTTAVSPHLGWKRDRSAGGSAMRIGGAAYDRGVGVHSTSSLVYNLDGLYTRFTSFVGIDDSVGNSPIDGSAEFQVWGDGVLLSTSPRVTGADGPWELDVDITGVRQLRLVTTTGGLPGDNDYKDHADWADAQLQTGPTLPRVSISASASSTSEAGSAFWTFTRTGDTSTPLAVNYSVSGTATNGVDYEQLSGSINIPAGESSGTAKLYLVDDSIEEPNETVVLTLQPSDQYAIGTASVTITIIDNDAPTPPPTTDEFTYLSDLNWTSAQSPYHSAKKDRAASGQPLRIGGTTYDKGIGVHSHSELNYNLGGQYTRFTAAVGIDDFVGNGAADGSAVFQVWGDNTLLGSSRRLTGADGPEQLDIDVTGVRELRLVTTTGGDSDYKDHANWADAKLYTGDIPSRPNVSIIASDPDASETPGNPGAFTLTRDGDLSAPLTVTLTRGGTATNNGDYQGVGGSFTFAAGEAQIIIPILPIDDGMYEGDETVVFTINNSSAYNVVNASATVMIEDNDTQPPPPVEGEVVYLSDLNWTSAQSPYHSARKDRAASGQPLRIGGVTYDKGIGVHSHSELIYNLGGQYTRFTAAVGIDDFVGNGANDGSSQFLVYGDGNLLFTSSRRNGSQAALPIDVDITGVSVLRLVTNTGGNPGDNDYKDHANWADAKLHREGEAQPPTADHGLLAQYYDNPDFTDLVATRIDPNLAMGTLALPWDLPTSSGDTFSVRWTGLIDPLETGQYTLTLDANQGVRLWVGGELVIDAWENAKIGDSTLHVNGTLDLVAGVKTPIVLEYFELTGNQEIFLTWTRPGGTTQTVPTDYLLPPQQPSGQPVRIMLVGDSVTEGEKDHASYRFWLDRMLSSAGVHFDFVGTRSGVHNSFVGGPNVQPIYPWFDQDHQSRWGATLDEVAGYSTPAADIALIHIGHNDIRGGKTPQQMIDDLSDYIDQLRSVNPDIKIAIAKPIANFSLGSVAEMDQYRALIPSLAAAKSTAQSPVIVVDQYTGFDPEEHTYDNVHPNETGEKLIAERFLAAIQSLLA